ncbi:YbaN family protein [Paracoccus sp. DMF-8]|uniref:YbaN family protein n=1 Tax=Paracoccus sp. DMF-8 TaxID=3019445 RepID=UPI0023E7AFA5|nr:YbaN family protein [Paracoccus sp. DMF-8]MDF3605135.1 YbaN family protein [Paracoccus sp. DMF-8]
MRILWLCIGWVALALGLIGAVLPVMPTVPFMLVAVWAFSRSSPQLRDRILNNPSFGPAIRGWQERGVISRKAKLCAIGAMSAGILFSLWLGLSVRVIAVQAAICAAVAVFIASRPET